MTAMRSGIASKGARSDSVVNVSWILAFALAIFATQIGSLERELISNESTYIVMAAHVLDGNLPYVELFDIKPPMIFLLLAGAMAVFGESLLVVRAVGDAFLLLSCIAVFAIARRRTGPVAAGLGVLALIAVHAPKDMQWTETGLLAAAMLMVALWLLLARRERLWAVAAAGLLVSLAVLTRTNLGVVAVAFGGWLALAAAWRPWLGVRWRSVVVFAVAGLAPPGVVVLVYWQAGALAELYLAIVTVPVSYAGQMGVVENLFRRGGAFLLEALPAAPWLYLPFAATLAAGLAVSVRCWTPGRRRIARLPEAGPAASTSPAEERSGPADHELPWLMLGAVLLALLVNGNAYGHHWQAVYPLCAVFCAYGIGWMQSQARLRWAGYLLPAVALVGALTQTGPAAVRLATVPGHLSEKHQVRAVARAIAAARGPHDTIYAFSHQLVYWYLDMMPVSPIVHPSSLARSAVMRPLAAAGYVGEDEPRRILALRPTWLVVRETAERVPRYPYFDSEGADVLRDLLARHYRRFDTVLGDPVKIYRRRGRPEP